MKTLIYSFTILFVFSLSILSIDAQVNGDFRTTQSGNWSNKNIWQKYNNGSWQSTNQPPRKNQNATVSIRAGHTVVFNQNNVEILNLVVENGGKLYRNSSTSRQTITLHGDITCNGIIGNGSTIDAIDVAFKGTASTITGSGDLRFYTIQMTANPNNSTDLTIDTDVELYITTGNSIFNSKNRTSLNIAINPNASLTSKANIDLTDGTKLITLYLKSDNTGYGSFISPTVTDSDSLNTTVERYITENRWHYISSPVDDAYAGIFLDTYLKWFNEPDSLWTYIVNEDTLLTSDMQGYALWSSSGYLGNTTLQFSGTLNTGAKSIALSNTAAATHGSVGFNFVGNPYTSAIDWDYSGTNGWTKTNVDDAIYIWNSILGSYGSYVGGVSTNGVTNIIPAHQGFFVYCNTDPGLLGVDYGVQLHDTKPFMKSGTEINSDILLLRTEGNGYQDETAIRFSKTSTKLFDGHADAHKMMGLIEAPQIFSIAENGDWLSINTLPEPEQNEGIQIGFIAGIPGNYSIFWEGLDRINSQLPLFLEDLVNREWISLNTSGSYSFNYGFNESPHRFNLHFANPMGTDQKNELKVNIFSSNDYIIVHPKEVQNVNVSIFNLLGQEIQKQTLAAESIGKFYMNRNGYYIVKVSGDNFVETRKIFVK